MHRRKGELLSDGSKNPVVEIVSLQVVVGGIALAAAAAGDIGWLASALLGYQVAITCVTLWIASSRPEILFSPKQDSLKAGTEPTTRNPPRRIGPEPGAPEPENSLGESRPQPSGGCGSSP